MPESVPPALIERERDAGWPTIHPEDYCHWCGARNMLWFAPAIHWNTATAYWSSVTGRDGICCPQCFADMHAEATGKRLIWEIRPWTPESPDSGASS